MDLRKKTLIIFGIGLIVILAGFLIYSSSVLQNSYENMEKAEVQQDLDRVGFVIETNLGNLDSNLADWAFWDDTYDFAGGTNPGYIDDNLPPATFRTLDLDYILLFNQSRSLVYAREYNRTSGELEPVSPVLLETITRDYPLFTWDTPDMDSSTKGILFAGGRPVAIAVRPVLKSSGDGPADGIMIMGQNMDESRLETLSETTGVSVAFIDPATLPADPHLAPVADQFRAGNQVVILAETPDSIQGYTRQPELNINPGTYVIEISEPRTIYQSGISTLYSFILIILIATLVFGLIGIFLIDRIILSRISVITNDVRRIGMGDEEVRITEIPGNDELTELSIAINRMLEQLSRSRLLYKSILEDQNEMICRFGLDGRITFMNPAFLHNAKTLENSREPFSIYDVFNAAVSGDDLDSFLKPLTVRSPSGSGEQLFSFNGTDYVIAWTIRGIFDKEGALQEYQFVGRDITTSRQLDSALQQVTKKLTLLNQVTFRDIQNAVFTLNGYLTLERTYPDKRTSLEYHHIAEESIKKIEALLNFAKQYQDLGVRPPEWQNVHQSFLMGISHLDFTTVRRAIQLDDLEIYASPLLERVFFAFAKNILNHAKDSTEVSVGYTIVKGGLVLFFRDNGPGIPDSKKEKIFERGFGDQAGMDLFLVREILSITGMTIRETGTYGEGACFEIFIPNGGYRFPDTR